VFALTEEAAEAVPIHLVSKQKLADWLAGRSPAERAWVEAQGYAGEAGALLMLPGSDGKPAGLLVGIDAEADAAERDLWCLAGLSESLPQGVYRLAEPYAPEAATRLALGWSLGSYGFTRYKPKKRQSAELVWPRQADRARVTREAEAIFLGRDLINTPAGDLLPSGLAQAAEDVARRHGADFRAIVGDDLLSLGYPAIHAVGRASADAPRLIDMSWGSLAHPLVTLVGKGVCFDSGGLDIKPASGMQLMKKDMGGGATVLALAHMIMAAGLKLRLRVLLPAVENAIAGNAFRPFDVLGTRKGLTVEVGNTDAEGRLILADALTEADSEKPALLIDCATLTGAARVALGPELPVLFARQDALAERLLACGRYVADPLWRLPLWPGYRKTLDSKVADLSSTGESALHGAITAALFLAEFVDPATQWVHLDIYAWNAKSRPGRPEGGEPSAVRALYELVAGMQG
jgi:leucyl aminopeptidase